MKILWRLSARATEVALLTLLILLAACAPATQEPQYLPDAPEWITLSAERLEGYVTWTVTTEQPLDLVALVFDGELLTSNDERCKGDNDHLECVATRVGQVYQTSIGGAITAYGARACREAVCWRLRL